MHLSELLEDFPFNRYEKAVIVALAGMENATATQLVKQAGVPQGRIYAVLGALRQRGIVHAIPMTPKRFAIKDIKQALAQYLERRKQELAQQQASVRQMSVAPKALPQLSASSVAIYTGREEHLNATIALCSAARKELMQMAPLFIGSFATNRCREQALGRGVRARIIIPRVTAQNKGTVRQALAAGAEIRTGKGDLLSMLIRDGEECLLGIQDYRHSEERLTVLSRNKALLGALRARFDEEWEKAKQVRMPRRGLLTASPGIVGTHRNR